MSHLLGATHSRTFCIYRFTRPPNESARSHSLFARVRRIRFYFISSSFFLRFELLEFGPKQKKQIREEHQLKHGNLSDWNQTQKLNAEKKRIRSSFTSSNLHEMFTTLLVWCVLFSLLPKKNMKRFAQVCVCVWEYSCLARCVCVPFVRYPHLALPLSLFHLCGQTICCFAFTSSSNGIDVTLATQRTVAFSDSCTHHRKNHFLTRARHYSNCHRSTLRWFGMNEANGNLVSGFLHNFFFLFLYFSHFLR